jgi:hypothetical protein
MNNKHLVAVAICFALLIGNVGVKVAHADPIVPAGIPLGVVVVIFMATVAIEACGIWFLLKAFGVIKEEVPEYPEYTRRKCIIIALLLNLATFFLGNYILLPLFGALLG